MPIASRNNALCILVKDAKKTDELYAWQVLVHVRKIHNLHISRLFASKFCSSPALFSPAVQSKSDLVKLGINVPSANILHADKRN